MGAMLPKAVESTVIDRHDAKQFRIGVCEMNGWRNNMEDAHVVITQPDWGYFAVLDGHGGDMCSAFCAAKLKTHFDKYGCPKDDAAMRQLIFDVDASFLATGKASGSTATMCIVHKSGGGKCHIRVANAGDSRILLGRRNGKIIDGGGTDQGLTVDHKPSHPAERQRIYRCGGHVEEAAGGVARVNGELAVSRGFGDAEFKKTGGPGPEDRPVTCNPEFGSFECDESDFVMLVCDGVSEGDFPNPEVVKHAAAVLRETDDPGAAAEAICFKALETNSKDNITCMIVMLTGTDRDRKDTVFNPGPLSALNHKGFMDAYESMAKKAGQTLAQAAEKRFEIIQEQLSRPGLSPSKAEALQSEAQKLGTPPGTKGSAERAAWWRNWEQKLPEQIRANSGDNGDISDPDAMLMRMLMSRFGNPMNQPEPEDGRKVRVPELSVLKRAVEGHANLTWDARLASLAGEEGIVKVDDASDDTSQVRFPLPLGVVAWLPTNVLVNVSDGSGRGSDDAGAGSSMRRGLLTGGAGGLAGGRTGDSSAQRPLLPRLGQRSMAASTVGRGGSPTTSTPGHKERADNQGTASNPLSKLGIRKPK
eukprot:TRINITY_DN6111_c0_g4_i1.p1 TRINITY_DN6111_c0_g4~~TRINITY_DN6111_c0_g4_i1.p1  ORF type:complete len:589 (-),score=131.90 TRINITY_DN6111_c0_g4_i1:185-1951(-)